MARQSDRGKLLVVIGFSFREPQINEILRDAIVRNNLRVLWIDPDANDGGLLSAVRGGPGNRRIWSTDFGPAVINDLVARVTEEFPNKPVG